MNNFAGTTGYREVLDRFVQASESVDFEVLHTCIMHLIPTEPCRILDVGAGSGRDAAALAVMGHEVTAVEPLAQAIAAARQLHNSPNITWICDGYPDLSTLEPESRGFAFILCHAVWQHLEPDQRSAAIARSFELLNPGGIFALALRHGPVGAGTHSFPATATDTIALAESHGFRVVMHLANQASAMTNKAKVHWTRLAFTR